MKTGTKLTVSIIAVIMIMAGISIDASAVNLNAVASNVTGLVQKAPADKDTWTSVKNMDKLRVGDRVKTGDDGSVILTFDSGNVISISPMTLVSITELSASGSVKRSVVSIDNGRLLAFARKLGNPESLFEVRTPYGAAGVRGSEVVVTVTEDSATFQVLSGSFDVVVNGVSAVLEAGFQMDILSTAIEPPPAMDIPPASLQNLKQEMEGKKTQGQNAEAKSEAQDISVDEMDDMMDTLDRANEGSCHPACSMWSGSECIYEYISCDNY